MMKKVPEADLRSFLSRQAAECVIRAYLHHYKSSQSIVANYFRRAKPILDHYTESDPQVFKLLVDLAQKGWCES